MGARPPWELNGTAKTPLPPLTPWAATRPPPCLLSSAHRYPGLFCFRPAAPEAQGSNPRTGGGWDPLSRPQPQPSFLTPTPAASISTQMAEPEATLSLHFLSLP